MKVFHWQSKKGNFGDDLNLWLWPELMGESIHLKPDSTLVGVGTVLSSRHLPDSGNIYVFGSGTGYGNVSQEIYKNYKNIQGVRGPLSAKILNLESCYVLADPAILIPDIIPSRTEDNGSKPVIFIPHIESLELARWEEICDKCNIELVNATDDSKEVINKIANASLVLAESMHAAIIADAYRVPWVPVWTSRKISKFKWSDWALAVGAKVNPIELPSPTFAIKFNNFAAKITAFNDSELKSADFNTDVNADSIINEYEELINKRKRMSKTFLRKCLNKIAPLILKVSPLISSIFKLEKKTIRSLSTLREHQGFLSELEQLDKAKARLYNRLDEFKKLISE